MVFIFEYAFVSKIGHGLDFFFRFSAGIDDIDSVSALTQLIFESGGVVDAIFDFLSAFLFVEHLIYLWVFNVIDNSFIWIRLLWD